MQGAPLSDDPVCDKGYYLNTTCIPCSICAEGHGVKYACEDHKDTVCNQCPEGQYSKQISGNRLCTNCTNCSSLNRNLASTCTREKNTICGSCTKGYFLQINRDGSTYCAECSLCPPGEEAMRWYECADMPESHQCAPGIILLTSAKFNYLVCLLKSMLGKFHLMPFNLILCMH